MINFKSVGISAGIGFVLSFLTGIISRNAFGTVLVRALIFALVFAGMAAGISFLYKMFLSDSGESLYGETSGSASTTPVTGSKVDIVVSDENIEDDDSGPKFHVENNRQGLSENPGGTAASHEKAPAQTKIQELNELSAESVEDVPPQEASQSFKPVSLGNSEQIPAMDAINPSNPAHRRSGDKPLTAGNGAINSVDNLQELPEIGDFTDNKQNDESDVISDSDFAKSSSSSGGSSALFPDGTNAESKNTDIMAQAIRTLLSSDNN